MPEVQSLIPLYAVLASLAAAPLIAISWAPNVREFWTFLAAALKLALVLSMLPVVLAGHTIYCPLVRVLPGLELAFRVDALGMIFAVVASSLWIVTSAYSVGYMRGLAEHAQNRYFTFFALALSSTLGVAFAGNLLTLYLFYEMLSFATYPLVTHHQDAEARSSGRTYLMYIVGGSIALVLPAMIICYAGAGTLDFTSQGFMAGHFSREATLVLLLMLVMGFAKVALMPMHSWLPAAMVAPTPVSALLHAVAVVKAGAFSVVRVMTGVFGVNLLADLNLGVLVGYIASFTLIAASLIALSQDGLKRRLAFSTIGQLAYIVLGLSLLSPDGMFGGMMHIAMHAFGKITLFFCAGAIFVATGKKNISEMTGLGRKMPLTMAAFFIGAISVTGLPPTGGFLSKWYLLLGTLQAHQLVFLVVLLFSSLLNAAYFLPIVYRAFFITRAEDEHGPGLEEAPMWCLVPLLITAAVSVVLFFYPEPFYDLAKLAVAQVTGASLP
ncbi:MAG: monovalent cation/H+ antiporter subunit D family protein [Deltaproteobacteria bacterium]|nr:monovalent cation/H+ antiporter subunit D family protein [Deltaproteobacteria bacterium]